MGFFIWIYAILVFDLKGVALMGDSIFSKLLPSALLGLGFLRYAFFEKGRLYTGIIKNQGDFFLYALFLLSFLLSLARTGSPKATPISITSELMNYALIGLTFYLAMSYVFRYSNDLQEAFPKMVFWLILAPSSVIIFNLMFYFLANNGGVGIDASMGEEGYAVMLSKLGIHIEKRVLPFSGYHPNTVGVYAGAMFVLTGLSLLFLQLSDLMRKGLWANLALLLIFILIVDSRGTLANSLLTIIVVWGLNLLRKLSLLKPLVFIIPIMPLLLLAGLGALSQLGGMEGLSRSDNDLATANGRSDIWEYCMEEFEEMKLVHYIGYGEFGHYTSGVSLKYAYIFGKGDGKDAMVVHNSVLQVLFDMGIFGLLLWLLVVFIGLRAAIFIHQTGHAVGIVLVGYMLYYMLSGTTESNFGNYNRAYNTIFFVMLLAIFVVKNEVIKERLQLVGCKKD